MQRKTVLAKIQDTRIVGQHRPQLYWTVKWFKESYDSCKSNEVKKRPIKQKVPIESSENLQKKDGQVYRKRL